MVSYPLIVTNTSEESEKNMKKIIQVVFILGCLVNLAYAQTDSVMRDTHENLNAVLWMQTAAEYQMITRGIYRNAKLTAKIALLKPSWSAAIEQIGANVSSLPPAIIVDIDETILDNSKAQALAVKQRGGFKLAEWQRWVRKEEATPIPGALEFLTWAASSENDITIFYVTNRSVEVENATFNNLKKYGFPLRPGVDTILSRGEYEVINRSSDKTLRRKHVSESYRILMLVGDDLGDFVSVEGDPEQRIAKASEYEQFWGERWVVLPNPAYGSWERSLFKGKSSDFDKLNAKFDKLEGFD